MAEETFYSTTTKGSVPNQINKTVSLIILLTLLFISPLSSHADTIILKDGTRTETKRSWEKDGKITFYVDGMVTSIMKNDVERIEKNNLGHTPPTYIEGVKNKNVSISDAREKEAKPIEKPLAHHRIKPHIKGTLCSDFGISDGFRDLRWGAKLLSITGMVKIETETDLAGVEEYIRPHDVLRIGEAELKSIIYAFWQGKLYSVTVWTQDYSNYKALQSVIFERFGNGSRRDESLERYIWSNKLTDRMLEYINEGMHGMLWMRSREIDRQLKLLKYDSAISYIKWMKSRTQEKEQASIDETKTGE